MKYLSVSCMVSLIACAAPLADEPALDVGAAVQALDFGVSLLTEGFDEDSTTVDGLTVTLGPGARGEMATGARVTYDAPGGGFELKGGILQLTCENFEETGTVAVSFRPRPLPGGFSGEDPFFCPQGYEMLKADTRLSMYSPL